jgi:transcriptional regulator with XRE-family HTH domain
MYGHLLRSLRESRKRSQVEVARSVGLSPAHLARLEANKRGLYVEDFVRIAEELGEKPGNLLPNDLGDVGHLKPIVDRLAALNPEHLSIVASIIEQAVLLTQDSAVPSKSARKPAMSRRAAKERTP